MWNGDSCTVTVVRPEAMEDIGNGMWMLPQPPDGSKWFYMDIKGPLFVRKCVRDICEKVVFPRLLQNTNDKRVCMITGTPGIGKSVMTNWVIAMIRSYFKDKDIYLFHFSLKLRYLIQRNGWCFEITKEYYNNAVMHNPDAIVLIDTGGKKSDDNFKHAGFAMVTASPAALPTEMEKEAHSNWAYLSVWEVEDILAAYFYLNPDDKFGSKEQADASYAEMKRRYAFAGGVPRILFGESGLVKKYEGAVDPAIERALSNFKNEVELKDNVHKVFHINPKDILDEYKTGFATIEIKTRFNLALKATSFKKAKSFMVDLVDMNFNLSALQSTAGVGFEVLANENLADHGFEIEILIKWRHFQPPNNVGIGILAENHEPWQFVADAIDSYEDGFLYVARRANQPVIDSWTKKGNVLFLFQITKQKTRRLGDKEIKFFTKILRHKPKKKKKTRDIKIRFVYVVPTQIKKFDILNLNDFDLEVSIGVLKVNIAQAKLESNARNHIIKWIVMKDDPHPHEESTNLFVNKDDRIGEE